MVRKQTAKNSKQYDPSAEKLKALEVELYQIKNKIESEEHKKSPDAEKVEAMNAQIAELKDEIEDLKQKAEASGKIKLPDGGEIDPPEPPTPPAQDTSSPKPARGFSKKEPAKSGFNPFWRRSS